MNLKDLDAAFLRRSTDRDVPIETTGSKQRGIKHVGAVCRCQHDHGIGLCEPIHFAEDLIQRLLALVVSAAQARASLSPDGIDFVDEDDTGRVFFRIGKQIAHAARSDTNEHLNEFRSVHGVKRSTRFSRDSAREQRLAGSWRSHEQDAFGNAASQALKLLRLAQVLDDFQQIVFDPFESGYILEQDRLLCGFVSLRRALAETRQEPATHHLLARTPHRDPQKAKHHGAQQQRDAPKNEHRRLGRGPFIDGVNFLVTQKLIQVGLCRFGWKQPHEEMFFEPLRILDRLTRGIDRRLQWRVLEDSVSIFGAMQLDALHVVRFDLLDEEVVVLNDRTLDAALRKHQQPDNQQHADQE